MTRDQAREATRELLEIMPLVMRTVAAELRFSGELPTPAHFPLLMMLDEQPRTLTELAVLRGVSPPTMSNSITALVQRGWVRRSAPVKDRRVVILEVTSAGRAALERVGRCAEGHLAEVLAAARCHLPPAPTGRAGGAEEGVHDAAGVRRPAPEEFRRPWLTPVGAEGEHWGWLNRPVPIRGVGLTGAFEKQAESQRSTHD